jgi:hypothetical protein
MGTVRSCKHDILLQNSIKSTKRVFCPCLDLNPWTPILTKKIQRLYYHGVAENQLTGDFWPGCTGANPGYSMVNVGRRSGGLGKTFRNSFLSNYLSQPLDI